MYSERQSLTRRAAVGRVTSEPFRTAADGVVVYDVAQRPAATGTNARVAAAAIDTCLFHVTL